MASSSDDPTDLISFFTPEELWEDLIEDWPNQKGKPHARHVRCTGMRLEWGRAAGAATRDRHEQAGRTRLRQGLVGAAAGAARGAREPALV